MATEAIVPDMESGAEVEVDSGAEPQQETEDDPYSPKSSREFSQALKAWRDGSPDSAKFARVAKDDHARLYQLHQMEPKGLDGVREKYALLDSVMHGELKGVEAVAAIQDQLREFSQVDEMLASGDPRALESLGDDFTPGLAKLAPAILDRVKAADPEAYKSAIAPHVSEALRSGTVLADYDGIVELLNQQPPQWLTSEQKQAWSQDRMNSVIAYASRMGDSLRQMLAKQQTNDQKAAPGKDSLSEREQKFNQEQQQHHWKTNIDPKIDAYGAKLFNEQFAPFAKRLRLPADTVKALQRDFETRITQKAQGNKQYLAQINRLRSQRNPSADAVLNLSKVEANKYAKSVMESLVNERYKPFLNGTPRAAAQPGAKRPPVAPGVQIVSVKPKNVDLKNTPLDWIHQRKYRTTDGKVVQVRQ